MERNLCIMVFLLVADLTLLVVVGLFFLLVPFAVALLPHDQYSVPDVGAVQKLTAEDHPSRLSTAEEHN